MGECRGDWEMKPPQLGKWNSTNIDSLHRPTAIARPSSTPVTLPSSCPSSSSSGPIWLSARRAGTRSSTRACATGRWTSVWCLRRLWPLSCRTARAWTRVCACIRSSELRRKKNHILFVNWPLEVRSEALCGYWNEHKLYVRIWQCVQSVSLETARQSLTMILNKPVSPSVGGVNLFSNITSLRIY